MFLAAAQSISSEAKAWILATLALVVCLIAFAGYIAISRWLKRPLGLNRPRYDKRPTHEEPTVDAWSESARRLNVGKSDEPEPPGSD